MVEVEEQGICTIEVMHLNTETELLGLGTFVFVFKSDFTEP